MNRAATWPCSAAPASATTCASQVEVDARSTGHGRVDHRPQGPEGHRQGCEADHEDDRGRSGEDGGRGRSPAPPASHQPADDPQQRRRGDDRDDGGYHHRGDPHDDRDGHPGQGRKDEGPPRPLGDAIEPHGDAIRKRVCGPPAARRPRRRRSPQARGPAPRPPSARSRGRRPSPAAARTGRGSRTARGRRGSRPGRSRDGGRCAGSWPWTRAAAWRRATRPPAPGARRRPPPVRRARATASAMTAPPTIAPR